MKNKFSKEFMSKGFDPISYCYDLQGYLIKRKIKGFIDIKKNRVYGKLNEKITYNVKFKKPFISKNRLIKMIMEAEVNNIDVEDQGQASDLFNTLVRYTSPAFN